MAFLEIKNVKICGFSACVPSKIEYNKDYPFYAEGEFERQLPTIGVEKRHIIEEGTTASDLCLEAAEKLIQDLNWDKDEIQLVIYSSPARDYVFPDTACILQDRLGLSKSTMAFDMTLGCTGWSYAINVISSIMSANKLKKALLLNGNMTTTENAYTDKTAYPLFSDAGSATAIEYDENAPLIVSEVGTDGSGYDCIIMKDGGRRHPFTLESLELKEYGENIKRSDLHMAMKGMEVFAFALKTAPNSVLGLLEHIGKTVDDLDLCVFHQANLFMLKKIVKKLKLPSEKVPFSIYQFGNTGSCSIPLTIVTERAEQLRKGKSHNIGCAFGVGLSWGSVYFETENLVIPELIIYKK